MYIKNDPDDMFLKDFKLPFSGHLNPKNRWVRLYRMIPWEKLEKKYASLFSKKTGAPAKPIQTALGALIIQAKCGFTDRETVEHIRENPYMQLFIGIQELIDKDPFDSTMMVFFRKRLNAKTMNEINEIMTLKPKDDDEDDPESGSGAGEEKPDNKGKLILDATCAPADIRYPTDISLLNEAREKLEAMIDKMHEQSGADAKPRTYRKIARRNFLRFVKNRKPTSRTIRKAVGKQLRYVKRDLRIVNELAARTGLFCLSKTERRNLLVISEVYRQQWEMYREVCHCIEGRIVNITQPHVRPIVRGKASAGTEFGAKLSISVVGGFSFLDRISWDNYNEGSYVADQVEAFRRRFGFYPKALIADKIYRNRENLKYCESRGIRLSGPLLGRPPEMSEAERRRRKLVERTDNSIRNQVEGKFGEGKRAYGLGKVMTKLKVTSETWISLVFLAINLEKKLRLLLLKIYFMVVFRPGAAPGCL